MRLYFANRFTDFTNTTQNWIVLGICYPTSIHLCVIYLIAATISQISYDGRNNPVQAASLNALRSNLLNPAAKVRKFTTFMNNKG